MIIHTFIEQIFKWKLAYYLSNEVKRLINEESYWQKRKNEFLSKVNKGMLGELAIVLIEMLYGKERALNILQYWCMSDN